MNAKRRFWHCLACLDKALGIVHRACVILCLAMLVIVLVYMAFELR